MGQREMIDKAAAWLEQSPVLGRLGRKPREALLQQGRLRQVPPGTDLFSAGDPCQQIAVLLQGRVRLWRLSLEGHVLVLRLCPPGEILGQMSALDGAPHSVHATAEQQLHLWQIPVTAFRQLLLDHPPLALEIAAALARRVRCLSEELEAMKFSSIGQRLVRRLQSLAHNQRELQITHQQLAEQIGSTRENVSRALALLREEGILRLRRGAIEIIDHDRLAQTSL